MTRLVFGSVEANEILESDKVRRRQVSRWIACPTCAGNGKHPYACGSCGGENVECKCDDGLVLYPCADCDETGWVYADRATKVQETFAMGTLEDDLQANFDCIAAMGVTMTERHAIETMARVFVTTGDLDELLRQFFNQVADKSMRAGLDWRPVLEAIVEEMRGRLDGPRAPDEFSGVYGGDEGG